MAFQYSACSINDIVNLTGVNRFSLYNEFVNKEGILLEALKLYEERYANVNLEILDGNTELHSTLKNYFNAFLIESEKSPTGDFILYIATELADTDEKVKEILDSYLTKIQSKIGDLLIRYNFSVKESEFYSKHLIGLFCNIMCFCIIKSKKERELFIDNGLNLLLNKKVKHVA